MPLDHVESLPLDPQMSSWPYHAAAGKDEQ